MPKINASKEQLEALEVFKEMSVNPNERRDYANAAKGSGKKAIFDKNKGNKPGKYDDIPSPARDHLEKLSEHELKVLADLDEKFVDAGLSVDTNPVPLMLH